MTDVEREDFNIMESVQGRIEIGEAMGKRESKTVIPVQNLWGLGVIGTFVWFGWMNKLNTNLGYVGHWQYIYAVLSISLVAIALASYVVTKRWRVDILAGAIPGRYLDWASALIMAAAASTLALANGGMVPPFSVDVATLCGGLALGWQYARWSRFFAGCPIVGAAFSILGTATLWPLAEIVIALLPFAASSVIIAVLPIFSLSMFLKASTFESAEPVSATLVLAKDRTPFAKVWIVVFSISLISSVFLMTKPESPSPFGALDEVIVNLLTSFCCLMLLLWALRTNWPFGFSLFWKVVAVVLGFAYMLSAIPSGGAWAQVFTRIVPGMLVPMVWLTVCDLGHRYSTPGVVACLGLVAYSSAIWLSVAFGGQLLGVMGSATLKTLLLFSLLVVVAVLLETRDPDMGRIFSELRVRPFEPVEFASIDERCRDVGGRAGLTDREIEIMALVCKGRSRSFIAEALFVTENTVKSHTAHVYSKLGVHSRRELQQLIEL